MSTCDRAEALRDYAFDELPAGERPGMEQHLAVCETCAAELDQLRVTTAALRVLPDREIPQRIAFVSDKVFQPSALARFFGSFWNSAARLGFASACVLGGALVVSAWHRPAAPAPQVRTIVQTADVSGKVSKQVNEAVEKAVAQAVSQAVAQVRQEDARLLAASEVKHEQEHRALMDAVTVLQAHLNVGTLISDNRTPTPVEGQ